MEKNLSLSEECASTLVAPEEQIIDFAKILWKFQLLLQQNIDLEDNSSQCQKIILNVSFNYVVPITRDNLASKE